MFANANPYCKKCSWKLTPDEDGQSLSCPLCGSVYTADDYDPGSSQPGEDSASEPPVSEDMAKLALDAALRVAQKSLKQK